MSLTGRVSAFFLGALAVALAGSGAALYAITATYFARQADERLTAALDTLASAAEVNPPGVEWEPNDRNLTLGRDTGDDAVRWSVRDATGRTVAESPNLGGADLADGERWRSRTHRVAAGWLEDDSLPKPTTLAPGFYDQLVLTAAISPHPGSAALSRLRRAILCVGIGAWLAAAVVGRRLCRRALRPVHRMAVAAASMSAADLGQRLAPAGTGDELDELGGAFNGLLGRLEETFERQRRFTGDAAHQLSTPLTVLLGQLEVALRRDRSAEEYRSAIAEAHSRAVHLRRIVELLLFLARPEADAAPPPMEVVDVSQWLPDHLGHWKAHPRGGDLRLAVPATGSLQVAVAPALLGQLVDNLLDNALKYSLPGSVVAVRLESAHACVLLRVEDAGVGIPADELGHVFEPFYRASGARRTGKPGVGLGLAVARRIADALGGTLTVESEPGAGSRFTLRLPAVSPARVGGGSTAASPSPDGATLDGTCLEWNRQPSKGALP
jgi:heavy metal sensor kinase